MTPAAMLKLLLDEFDIERAEAARILGIEPRTLNGYLYGERPVPIWLIQNGRTLVEHAKDQSDIKAPGGWRWGIVQFGAEPEYGPRWKKREHCLEQAQHMIFERGWTGIIAFDDTTSKTVYFVRSRVDED